MDKLENEENDVVVESEETDVGKNELDNLPNTITDVGSSSIELPKDDDVAVVVEEADATKDANDDAEKLPPPSSKKKRKQKSTDPAEVAPAKRERRERKTVEAFNPDAYRAVDPTANIIDGRGKRLEELSSCVKAMESTQNAVHMPIAYKMIFRHKLPKRKKDMLQNLLQFSGYLPKKDAALTEEEQDKLDNDYEAKMGAKAYKMTLPRLKGLCDFFGVDRRSLYTKDDVVDQLLDFLSEPSAQSMRPSSSTKSKRGKKSHKTSKAEDGGDEGEELEEDDDAGDADYDDVDEDKLKDVKREAKGGGESLPSSEKLRKWVRAYVRCFHETKLTVNHALEIASEKFGVDLTPKKGELRALLIDEI